MSDGTKIEWTDATWNPITGCSVVSPGCTNCYAMRLAGTRLQHHPSRAGLTRATKAGPVWTGDVRFNEEWLDQPLRWKRPRRIFVCAHGDLFHENVPDEWIDKAFAVMFFARRHTFQVLTKRPARMRQYLSQPYVEERWHRWIRSLPGRRDGLPAPGWLDRWSQNIWLGVSAEDQARADERIPLLLDTPAAVRWISAEPLLGPVDLEPWLDWPHDRAMPPPRDDEPFGCIGCENSCSDCPEQRAVYRTDEGPTGRDGLPEWVHCERLTIDWVVAGGEGGPGARPMHPDWARSLRDQCQAAGVAFHFKQHGEWIGVPDLRGLPDGQGPGFGAYDHSPYDQDHEAVRVGKRAAGRLLDGRTWDEWPSAQASTSGDAR